MFGRGRFQNGIIIEVKPAYAFDPSDTAKVDAFITDIWYVFAFILGYALCPDFHRPYVKDMNAHAPGHSRLFKEVPTQPILARCIVPYVYVTQMIIIAHPSRPFTYNHKGAPKRGAILTEYADDIEAVYTEVEKGISIAPPAEWTPATTLEFVRDTVNGILRQPAGDSDDLFEGGCDRSVISSV